jgi:hypothetical protein
MILTQVIVKTIFSLNNTSLSIDMRYTCSTSDYCDIEFVRETLSPAFAAMQMEPLRQKLARRLFNSNNTGPIQCVTNDTCAQNTTVCSTSYSQSILDFNSVRVTGQCSILVSLPTVSWKLVYTSGLSKTMIEEGKYQCNIPGCGHNATIIDVFEMLARDYILPINLSVFTLMTPPPKSTIISTTPNHATSKLAYIYTIPFGFMLIFFSSSSFNV